MSVSKDESNNLLSCGDPDSNSSQLEFQRELNPALENTVCLDTVDQDIFQSRSVEPEKQSPTAELFDCGDHMRRAMKKLLRAFRFAMDCNRSRWDFAVEIAELRGLGISNEELRWMIGKKLIDHAEEIPDRGETKRSFQAPGGFSLSKESCFVLTELGISAAQRQVELTNDESAPFEEPMLIPTWDLIRHELRMGQTVVKKFKWRAANQEAILCAFEEEGWPPRIDDPLPPIADKDPKRRLSDAIKCLNRKQRNSVIRFTGDGTGEGVYWEIKD